MEEAFEDRYATVGDARARYWRAGESGEPVLLLGGIGCSVLEWRANVAALAGRHVVYALDMLGEGLTDKPDGDRYALPDLARFTLGFLDAVGADHAHVVGNSLGGRLALECARQAPERVRSMTLVAPAGVGRETHVMMRLPTVRGVGEVLTRPSRSGLRMLWRLGVHDRALITDDLVEAKFRFASAPGAHQAFLRTLRGFVGIGGFEPGQVQAIQAVMPSMTQPTLVVWGEQDRLLPVAQAGILRRLLPNVDVCIFDRCGHLPQMEHPQRFNDTLLGFLGGVA